MGARARSRAPGCVCECVCVRARACVFVCLCVRVRVCVRIGLLFSIFPRALPIFPGGPAPRPLSGLASPAQSLEAAPDVSRYASSPFPGIPRHSGVYRVYSGSLPGNVRGSGIPRYSGNPGDVSRYTSVFRVTRTVAGGCPSRLRVYPVSRGYSGKRECRGSPLPAVAPGVSTLSGSNGFALPAVAGGRP